MTQMNAPQPPTHEPLRNGWIQTTTAWLSVPKFVRFAVWMYAIATVITVAVVVGGAALLMLAAVS